MDQTPVTFLPLPLGGDGISMSVCVNVVGVSAKCLCRIWSSTYQKNMYLDNSMASAFI